MPIQAAADYQAGLLEIKRLMATSPDDTAAIATLSEALDDYEIQAGQKPVRPDILIGRLEIEMFNRQLNRQQMAQLLDIPASRFSDLLNGKTNLNTKLAKKLYQTLHIPAEFILEAA